MSMNVSDHLLPGEASSGESAKAYGERSAYAILRAVRRRKLLAGGLLGLGLIGSLVLANILPPTYTATAIVEVNPNKSQWTNFNNNGGDNAPPDPMYVRSEVNVLQSRATAGRVVDRLNLVADPEFNPMLDSHLLSRLALEAESGWTWLMESVKAERILPFNNPADDTSDPKSPTARALTINRVLNHLVAENDNRSYTINVEFTSRNAAKAATIANAFAEEYINLQVQAKTEAVRRAYDWLSVRVPQLRQEVQDADRQIQQFREQHNLVRVEPNGTSEATQQLQEMTTQLVMAEATRAAAQAKLDHARQALRANDANSIPEVLASPLIQYLQQQQSTLSRRVAELSETYGENYPLLRNTRAELADVTRKIAAETNKIIAAMAQEVQTDQTRINALRSSLNAMQANVHASDRVHVQLQELESAAEAKRTLLKTLSERYEQASFLQNMAVPDTRIVGHAEVPPLPSGPHKLVIVAVGLVISAIVLGVIVYLLERLDPGFRTVGQVEAAIGLPCVAMVPMLAGSGLRRIGGSHRLSKTKAIFAESVRMARGAVLHTKGKSTARIIVVTSSVPEEGKSVFAAAFARSLVEAGRSVLLIDGDLRRPRIGQMMGIKSGGPGLQDVMARRVSAEEAIRRDMNNRLHVLPAGDAIEGEEDAIEPEKIWRVLADCCTMYDAIVIDTPPVLVVADASVLARVADSVLYVVQWARTPRETVMAGLRRLRMVSDAAVKLVLSKVDLTEHARYRFKDEGYYASVYETYYAGRDSSSGRRAEIAALAAVAGDKPSFGPARGEA